MNNEDKILALLDQMDSRLGRLEEDVTSIKEMSVRMEFEHGNQIKALFDMKNAHAEKLDAISEKLEHVEVKIDDLDVYVSYHHEKIKNLG